MPIFPKIEDVSTNSTTATDSVVMTTPTPKPLHCLKCEHPDGLKLAYNLYQENTKTLVHVYEKPGAWVRVVHDPKNGQGILHPGVGMICSVEKGDGSLKLENSEGGS